MHTVTSTYAWECREDMKQGPGLVTKKRDNNTPRYSAPHSEPGPLAQPPISGACAPGPGRDWSPGRPSSHFFPAPGLRPRGSKATRSQGLQREEDTHLVGVTCCLGPARESPPGPGSRRGPQPGQAAPAPHPRPAPAAGREGGTGFS